MGTAVACNFVASGNNLIAGTWGAYIYLSKDGGLNWALQTSLPCVVTNAKTHLIPIPKVTFLIDGTNVYAGVGGAYNGSVSFSTDNGMTWLQKDSTFIQNINCFAEIGKTIYAGTDFGIFLSKDMGKSWNFASSGISYQITQLAVIDTTLFAATSNDGLFRSKDEGVTWSLTDAGLPSKYILGLAVVGSNIFAQVSPATPSSTGGVFISSNYGVSWSESNNGLTNHNMVSVLYSDGSNLFAGTNEGVFLSMNKGGVWMNISVGSQTDSLGITGLGLFNNYLLVGTGGGGHSSGTGIWLYPLHIKE